MGRIEQAAPDKHTVGWTCRLTAIALLASTGLAVVWYRNLSPSAELGELGPIYLFVLSAPLSVVLFLVGEVLLWQSRRARPSR